MNGYGQQMQNNFNPQLMEAIALQEQLRNKQHTAQGMINPNGAGGIYDILGAALGGVMSNKYGKQAAQGEADINQQIQAFQQQKAQEAEQRAMQKEQAKYERDRADKLKDFEMNQGGKMAIAKYKTDNAKGGVNVYTGNQNPNVKTGTVPPGFAQVFNPETNMPELVRMKGGDQEKEQINNEKQMKMAISNDFANFKNIDGLIDKTINDVGYLNSGLGGDILSSLGGSGAKDLKANLDTIGADAAFSTLINLKKAGGTLGAISQSELDLLKSAKASLDASQSPGQLKENLQRYKDVREQSMQRVGEAHNNDFGYYPDGFEPKEQQSQKQGGQIMIDANGNKAIVYPDGSYEEQ